MSTPNNMRYRISIERIETVEGITRKFQQVGQRPLSDEDMADTGSHSYSRVRKIMETASQVPMIEIYENVEIPVHEERKTTIFEQSVEDLNLGLVVAAINKLPLPPG